MRLAPCNRAGAGGGEARPSPPAPALDLLPTPGSISLPLGPDVLQTRGSFGNKIFRAKAAAWPSPNFVLPKESNPANLEA